MAIIDSTPQADGFRMPAEWEPQRRIWMGWPTRSDNWRDAARPAQRAFIDVANTISEFEPVMLVAPPGADVPRAKLSSDVTVLAAPYDDAWFRDIGPTFVCDRRGEVRAVDWPFNAWGGAQGGLYESWANDDALAGVIAEAAGVARYRADFILEGGAIHVDGEGTCLTTEACLLHPNRNPALSRSDIENRLRAYLDVACVVWLGDGMVDDETDGHIDNLGCFLRPGAVALAWTDDRADPQHAVSQEALARLRDARDAQGRALELIRLPIPRDPLRMTRSEADGITRRPGTHAREAGQRLAASYVNFLLCNDAVIVPAFGDPNDDVARGVLAEQFPSRVVRLVPSREILLGGGNVHCITQQEPAPRA